MGFKVKPKGHVLLESRTKAERPQNAPVPVRITPSPINGRRGRRHVQRPPDPQLLEDLRSAIDSDPIRPDDRLIAVIVPVLARPHRVKPLLDSFLGATAPTDAALYFVAQRSDRAEVDAISAHGGNVIIVGDDDRSWAKKINRGYLGTTEPWLLLGADDLAFRPGWVSRIHGLLLSHPGVIGTNDLGNQATVTGSHSTHPLVRRVYADVCGTVDERRKVVHDGYDHNFPDTELVSTAKHRGLYTHRTDCVIEHLHPSWGKGAHDAIYARGQVNFASDRALFLRRSRQYGLS